LFVTQPTTWSAIRRLKEGQRRYLFAVADAAAAEGSTIGVIPVLVTSDMTTGTGLFINNSSGSVLIGEGLKVTTDPYSASTNNVIKLVGEERIPLAVERPNALLGVTNLGTESEDA
jgi:HK97 family phage major capsid protein